MTIFANELKIAFISRRARLIPAHTCGPAPNARLLTEPREMSDFLTLRIDADLDIPILIAAKAEYAKLN